MSDFMAQDIAHQMTPTDFDNLDAKMVFQSDGAAVERRDDHKLAVKFYMRPVKNMEKSEAAGRAVHENVTFINIKIPGDKYNDVDRAAWPDDYKRFPQHYARFQQNREQLVGTPLATLPFLTEAQVMDYAHVNVRTVEQLAGMSDVNAQQLFGSVGHKQKAAEWLENFKSASAVREDLQAKLDEQAKQIEELKKQLAPKKA